MARTTPTGFSVADGTPVDDRISVASAEVRLGRNMSGGNPVGPIFPGFVYRGLMVFQEDNQTLYRYVGPGPDYDPSDNMGVTTPIDLEEYWVEINSNLNELLTQVTNDNIQASGIQNSGAQLIQGDPATTTNLVVNGIADGTTLDDTALYYVISLSTGWVASFQGSAGAIVSGSIEIDDVSANIDHFAGPRPSIPMGETTLDIPGVFVVIEESALQTAIHGGGGSGTIQVSGEGVDAFAANAIEFGEGITVTQNMMTAQVSAAAQLLPEITISSFSLVDGSFNEDDFPTNLQSPGFQVSWTVTKGNVFEDSGVGRVELWRYLTDNVDEAEMVRLLVPSDDANFASPISIFDDANGADSNEGIDFLNPTSYFVRLFATPVGDHTTIISHAAQSSVITLGPTSAPEASTAITNAVFTTNTFSVDPSLLGLNRWERYSTIEENNGTGIFNVSFVIRPAEDPPIWEVRQASDWHLTVNNTVIEPDLIFPVSGSVFFSHAQSVTSLTPTFQYNSSTLFSQIGGTNSSVFANGSTVSEFRSFRGGILTFDSTSANDIEAAIEAQIPTVQTTGDLGTSPWSFIDYGQAGPPNTSFSLASTEANTQRIVIVQGNVAANGADNIIPLSEANFEVNGVSSIASQYFTEFFFDNYRIWYGDILGDARGWEIRIAPH